MTRPGIEPQGPGPLANTHLIRPMLVTAYSWTQQFLVTVSFSPMQSYDQVQGVHKIRVLFKEHTYFMEFITLSVFELKRVCKKYYKA